MALPEGILLMHGSPGSDAAYLLETVEQDGVRDATSKEVQGRLEGVPEAIILCGHSHLPKTLELDGGCLIVNPGSVGLQGYEAQEPHPHKMEAGSPQARYATLDRRGGIWSARLHTVNYDWERAYKAAYQNGRLDWARALKFGRV